MPNPPLKDFEWESEVQEKGFGNLVQFMKKNGGKLTDKDLCLLAAYWVQRDHESSEYFTELWGDQISALQDTIRDLLWQARHQEARIQKLESNRGLENQLRLHGLDFTELKSHLGRKAIAGANVLNKLTRKVRDKIPLPKKDNET